MSGIPACELTRIAVRRQPFVEVALRFRVDLVAEVDVDALRRVFGVELLGDFAVDVGVRRRDLPSG